MKQKIKQQLTKEKLLCLIILLCPILDIASFTFRNYFNTQISISTFIRPIPALLILLYIFIKSDKKTKLKLILIGAIYITYGIVHLLIMNGLITGCSYGSVKSESQYICNFTFLIIYLIIFTQTFKNTDETKSKMLEKSITIMSLMYIISIYISILANVSSYTYIETKTGFKGLIESGNSLSAILLLSLFIVTSSIKKVTTNKEERKKEIIWFIVNVIDYILISVYLITMLATRTGLFGVIIVTFIYSVLQIIFTKNKKLIIAMIVFGIIVATLIGVFGSGTIKRRKQINEAKNTLIDESTGQVGNMTKDMLDIKNKILDGTLEEGFMSEAQKQAVLDLNEYATKHNIAGNDLRKLQLIYNIYLVKHQNNPIAILFGNGFKTNYREMVMENEFASMFLNFGIIGFILYIVPFIVILIYSFIKAIENYRKLNLKFIMLQSALGLSLVLSWASGYVFFATSSMVVIVTVSTLLLNETKKLYK